MKETHWTTSTNPVLKQMLEIIKFVLKSMIEFNQAIICFSLCRSRYLNFALDTLDKSRAGTSYLLHLSVLPKQGISNKFDFLGIRRSVSSHFKGRWLSTFRRCPNSAFLHSPPLQDAESQMVIMFIYVATNAGKEMKLPSVEL